MTRVCIVFTLLAMPVLVVLGILNADREPIPRPTYQFQADRYRALGDRSNLSPDEALEYLILDARLSVQEGLLTIEEFERYTGRKY